MLLAVSLSGCAKKSDGMPASESPTAADAVGQDDLGALERQLAAREDQLRSAGIGVTAEQQLTTDDSQHGPASPSASAPAPESLRGADADPEKREAKAKSEAPADRGGRCNQVCEISTAICELQIQICDLVPRHREDPRYQATCDRASADCRLSTEACHGCSDT